MGKRVLRILICLLIIMYVNYATATSDEEWITVTRKKSKTKSKSSLQPVRKSRTSFGNNVIEMSNKILPVLYVKGKNDDKYHLLYLNRISNDDGLITIAPGERLLLTCPGENNYVTDVEDVSKIKEPLFRTAGKLLQKKQSVNSDKCTTSSNQLASDLSSSEWSFGDDKESEINTNDFYLEFFNRVEPVRYVRGKEIVFADKNVLLKSLSKYRCFSPFVNTIQARPDEICHVDSYWYQIGFKYNGEFESVASFCYSKRLHNSLFSVHFISGKCINSDAMKLEWHTRPFFIVEDANYLLNNVHPAAYYNEVTIRRLFEKLFGAKQAEKYLAGDNFVRRGHLIPVADFYFQSWQMLTFYYANVQPMMDSVDKGNWLNVEMAIRTDTFKKNRKHLVKVISGVYLTLELQDSSGLLKAVFLVEEQELLPVPKYLFKILYDPEYDRGIAFVISNNPFYREPPLCPDICRETNWYYDDFKELSKGLTVCCEIKLLQKVIRHIPGNFENTEILRSTPTIQQRFQAKSTIANQKIIDVKEGRKISTAISIK